MTIRHAPHPVTGKPLYFGRNKPAPRAKKRYLGHYLARAGAALPSPPLLLDCTGFSSGSLYAGLSDVLANDSLGDCTSAAVMHIVDSFLGRAGSTSPALTAQQAIDFYSLSTGYVPGNPSTDQGGDEVAVIDTWIAKGVDGNGLHKAAARLDVDPADQATIKLLLFLFGNVYFGTGLPDAWTRNMPSGDGFVWDAAAPDEDQGHAYPGLGYTDQGVLIDTWGMIGTETWAAVAKCTDELHCVLSQEDLAAAKMSVPGVDWDGLVADWRAEGGSAPAA